MKEFSFEDEEVRLKVFDRFETWKVIGEEIIETFLQDNENIKLFLNEGILFLAAKSYFDDIGKYKFYSGSERVENSKISSYSLKWLSKLKPIQLISYDKFTDEKALQINNFFALTCACAAVEVNIDDLTDIGGKNFLKELMYNMQYRNISGKSYYLTFKLLEALFPDKEGEGTS